MIHTLQPIIDRVTNATTVGEIGHEIFTNWELIHQVANPGMELPKFTSHGMWVDNLRPEEEPLIQVRFYAELYHDPHYGVREIARVFDNFPLIYDDIFYNMLYIMPDKTVSGFWVIGSLCAKSFIPLYTRYNINQTVIQLGCNPPYDIAGERIGWSQYSPGSMESQICRLNH